MDTLATYAKIKAIAEPFDVEVITTSMDDESRWKLLGVEEQVHGSVLWFSMPSGGHDLAIDQDAEIRALTAYLIDQASQFGLSMTFESSIEQERNWNMQWEAGIQPFQWGSFWITPPWSQQKPPEGVKPIVIHPKMSFGTGTHETTQLMLSMLETLNLEGVHGVDAGTGTGILSVAALLRGAKSMLGFDVDHWSVNNAKETAALNGVDNQFTVSQGGFECLETVISCDMMVANIHTRVLLDGAKALVETCNSNAPLLLSGMLISDESIVIQRYQSLGCTLRSSRQQNDWVALHFDCPTR